MVRTRTFLISMLITALVASVMFFSTNIVGTYAASQDVIRPTPANAIELDLDFAEGNLQASTTAGYKYQYWIRTKVQTELSPNNEADWQYIWEMVKGYAESDAIVDIPVTANNIGADGRYHVIVRVKNDTTLIDEIYGSYAAAGISEVKIEGKAAQGETIIIRNSTVKVEIVSNSQNIVKYALYYGDEESAAVEDDESGVFDVPMNFKSGYHIFRAEIETAGGQKATQYLKVYIYDEYVAEERPMITSLTGTPDTDTDGEGPDEAVDGLFYFTMEVKYADGSPIPYADRNKFNFNLVSGAIKATPQIVDTGDGTFNVKFAVNYNGKHGIYQTTATVSRDGINGYDDKVIQYYDGYARTATLSQTASQKSISLPENAEDDYTSITITANGTIDGGAVAATDLSYAFYREDASGWVCIRGYQTISDNPGDPLHPELGAYNKFVWTPTKAGTYRIQARIKDVNAGSYEKEAGGIYTVNSVNLDGDLVLKIWDIEEDEEVTSLVAGRPYKLEAYYDGDEKMLYMFTLTSANLGTVYLNNYTVSPFLMFVPARPDNYFITARALYLENYGYMDASFKADVVSAAEVKVPRPDPAADEVESFDHPDSVANAINLDDNFGAEWLEEFEDETGVVRMIHASEWPAFSFLPRREMTDYADYDYLVIRMYVTADNPLLYLKLGNGTGVDAWALDGQYNIAIGEWKDYVYPIEPFLAAFNNVSDGAYDTERLWGQAASDDEGAIYISSITVAVAPRPAPAADEVESFDHPDSVYNAINLDDNFDAEWLEEYAGETGVVKMSYASAWPSFSFLPRREMADYADYDYIIIRMYVTDANPLLYLKLGNNSGSDAWALDGQDNIAVGQWKNYVYPIAPFLAVFNKISDGIYDQERLWGQAGSSAEGAIYISSITVSNEQRPAPAPNEVESYDHPDSAYNALNWNTNSVEWLSEYQGESGVVKMTYSSEWLAWSFLPRQEMSAYSGYNYITIRMYVEDTDNPIKYFILGNDSTIYSDQIDGRGNIASGEWKDYTFDIAPFLEFWHKIYDGDDTNERLWSQATNNNLGAIYISAIYVH